ncbi:hypothetical protein GCM10008986_16360 [Salinibacillus aidingensis]|uniref:HTH cro/C1-type domain-containing protein n=1 Tax=Salinibacillus aidingensis TaxID=237684 RepID=A0ABN1B643_9BACI
MEYGQMLRKMRKGADLSQEEIAERLHISRSNVSRLESNKLKLSFEDAVRWARTTDSQDMMVAMICNVDVSVASDMLNQIIQISATILFPFLGGLL